MLLRIGEASVRGSLERYSQSFDLAEVRAEPRTLPRSVRLHQWREEVPSTFVFSLVLGEAVGKLVDGTELDAALEYANKARAVLQPKWLVLQTGPSATPCRQTRRRLEAIVSRLRIEDCRVAWEPHGVWDPEQEEEVSTALNLVVVRDLRRSELPPGPVAYTRLRALGAGARLTAEAAEIIAERAAELEELYVVLEGRGSLQGAKVLRELMGGDH